MARVSQRLVRQVDAALASRYGARKQCRHGDPLDGLIQTILSQNTTDVNSRAAFAALKRRFPDWETARRARTSAIAAAIERGGLANIKSGRIKAILQRLHEERGRVNLDFLRRWSAQKATDYLLGLPGVGRKTAACVLLFDLGEPAFPVDTHVFRVATRLDWLSPGADPDRAHDELAALVPRELHYQLHLNMVAHGRQVCRPGRPKCGECPLLAWCPYGQERRAGGEG